MTNEERKKANVIGPWLAKLALATSAGQEKMTKDRLFLYVQLLSNEVQLTAFTDQSLADVAKGCEFFPAYAVLKTALEAWHEEHKPKPLALPLPDNLREQIDELRDNTNWRDKIEREAAVAKMDWMDPNKVRASAANLDGHPMRIVLGRMLARILRKHAPENLGYLPPEFLALSEERGR